jgi:hypothetical protein
MIFDIDKEASEKGAWSSLISEMSMGAPALARILSCGGMPDR